MLAVILPSSPLSRPLLIYCIGVLKNGIAMVPTAGICTVVVYAMASSSRTHLSDDTPS